MPASLRTLFCSLSTAAVLALGVVPATSQAATSCAGADTMPETASAVAVAKDATLCLLNEQRAQHGLGAFSESAVLDKAAAAYAKRMVAQRFFDHVSPDGGTFIQRIQAAGWSGGGSWTAGENIAWGSGSLGTPASIVDSWMHSAGHRANILNGQFGAIGIGIADGAPQAGIDGDAGTYVNDFTSPIASSAAQAKRATVKCATKAQARAARLRGKRCR
jgi:uncharacterized protein YkwD